MRGVSIYGRHRNLGRVLFSCLRDRRTVFKIAVGGMIAVVTALALLVVYNRHRLVCWWLAVPDNSMLPAGVEYDQFDSSLISGTASFRGLKLSGRELPDEYSVQADRLTLRLDPSALRNRQFVVNSADLEGLLVEHSPGRSEGPTQVEETGANDLAQFGKRWFENFEATLNEDVTPYLDCVALLQDLRERHSMEFSRLKGRSESVRSLVGNLDVSPRDSYTNPLRPAMHVGQSTGDADKLRESMDELKSATARFAGTVGKDADRLKLALKRDRRRLDQRFTLIPIEQQTLAEYLFRAEQEQVVGQLIDWLTGNERIIDELASIDRAAPATSTRDTQTPTMLIKSLNFRGDIVSHDHRYRIEGQATDLPSHPLLGDRPSKIETRLTGPVEMEFQTVLTKNSKRRRHHLQSHELPLPTTRWGNERQLSISVTAPAVSLSAEVETVNEKCQGEITITRSVGDLAGQTRLADFGHSAEAKVRAMLHEVEEVTVKVHISGKLQRPKWTVSSNIDNTLADVINAELQRLFDRRRDELMSKHEQDVAIIQQSGEEQLLKIRTLLAECEEKIRAADRLISHRSAVRPALR